MKKGLLAIMAAFLAAEHAQAQTAEDVIKALVERQKSVKTLYAEFESTTKAFKTPRGEDLKHDPRQLPDTSLKHTVFFDFLNGSHYWDRIGTKVIFDKSGSAISADYHSTQSYSNGSFKSVVWPKGQSYVGVEPGRTSDFAILTGDLSAHPFDKEYWPLFLASGRVPFSSRQTLYPGEFHRCGPGAEDGETILPSQSPAEFPFRADTVWFKGSNSDDRQFIFESIKSSPGIVTGSSLRYQKSQAYYNYNVQYDSKMTLSKWILTQTRQGKVVSQVECSVTKLLANGVFEEKLYDLKPNPGMVLSQIRFPKSDDENGKPESIGRFRVGENGVLQPLGSGNQNPEASTPWKVVLIVLLFATLSLSVFLLVFRKRFRK